MAAKLANSSVQSTADAEAMKSPHGRRQALGVAVLARDSSASVTEARSISAGAAGAVGLKLRTMKFVC